MAANQVSIDVTADTSDAEKGAERVATKWGRAADRMATAGNKLTTRVTLPLVALSAASFKLASDVEEATSQAVQVFGDGADDIIDAAGNMEDSFSEAEFLSFASTFGDIAQGMGFAKDEAGDLSLGVLELAQDLGSFKNLPTEQAINAITASMTGEREQLKSLGIVINEAMVQQRALADTGKDVAAELTRQEKATATLALITEQSTNAIGDFERTSGGAANASRIMTANFKDTASTLGENLIPIGMQLISVANSIAVAFGNMSTGNQKVVLGFAATAAVAGPLIRITAGLIRTFQTLAITIPAVTRGLVTLSGALGLVTVGFALAAGAYLAWQHNMKDDRQRVEDFANAILRLGPGSSAAADGITEMREESELLDRSMRNAGLSTESLAGAIVASEANAEAFKDQLRHTGEEAGASAFEISSLQAAVDELRDEYQDAVKQTKDVTDEFDDNADAAAILEEGIAELEAGMNDLEDQTADTGDEFNDLQTSWSDLVSDILGRSDSFLTAAEFMEEVRKSGETINDLTFEEAVREAERLAEMYGFAAQDILSDTNDVGAVGDFTAEARASLFQLFLQADIGAEQVERITHALDQIDGRVVTARVNVQGGVRGTAGRGFVPIMHQGGEFRAPPGTGGEGLALLRDGERVVPPGAGGGTGAVGGGMPSRITVPVTVMVPDGRILAEIVAEADIDAGGQLV